MNYQSKSEIQASFYFPSFDSKIASSPSKIILLSSNRSSFIPLCVKYFDNRVESSSWIDSTDLGLIFTTEGALTKVIAEVLWPLKLKNFSIPYFSLLSSTCFRISIIGRWRARKPTLTGWWLRNDNARQEMTVSYSRSFLYRQINRIGSNVSKIVLLFCS